jgi:hypothetical protein
MSLRLWSNGILWDEMRALVVIVALASAVTVDLAHAGAENDPQTRVRMLDTAPLTLRGIGFEAGERVRLNVALGERSAARMVRAGLAGGFTTTFEGLRYGRCGPSLTVKAVGSRGSRVSWTIVPLECPDRADS